MPFQGPTPSLEHVLDLRVDIGTPLNGGTTPLGVRNWFPFTGGSITSVPSSSTANSPTLSATILPGGGDYSQTHLEDGYVRLADISFVAKDDASDDLFKFHNTGFIKFDEHTVPILTGDTANAKSTEFGQSELVETITVTTGSKQWAWLNYATLIGQLRAVVENGGLAAFEIRVFSVKMK